MSPGSAKVIVRELGAQAAGPAFVMTCVLVASCNGRPPQTERLVLEGSPPAAVEMLVKQVAKDAGLQVSQKTFETPAGLSRNYEAYGGGMSIIVTQAMREDCPGPDGNYPPDQVDS